MSGTNPSLVLWTVWGKNQTWILRIRQLPITVLFSSWLQRPGKAFYYLLVYVLPSFQQKLSDSGASGFPEMASSWFLPLFCLLFSSKFFKQVKFKSNLCTTQCYPVRSSQWTSPFSFKYLTRSFLHTAKAVTSPSLSRKMKNLDIQEHFWDSYCFNPGKDRIFK